MVKLLALEGMALFFMERSWQNSAFRSRVQLLSSTRDRKVQEKSVSQPPASTVAIVLTTLGADADAAAIARTLIDERLAACVNILPPMTSLYRWQGKVEQDREQQIVIKTASDRVAALQARLRQLHPYELPEFLVVDATGSEAYLAWIGESAR
jgi:periplasmic divalent cation tolerance protein